MTINITPEQMLLELTEIAEKKKAEVGVDYVYERAGTGQCAYVHHVPVDNGTVEKVSGCIIGRWAESKGIPLDHPELAINLSASATLEALGFRGRGVEFAREVQVYQDKGIPWCQAVAEAADEWKIKLEEEK